MASFTHLEYLRRRFRDPSAVLSTKLGSTLLKKPIGTVSLHRLKIGNGSRAEDKRLEQHLPEHVTVRQFSYIGCRNVIKKA